MWDQLDESGDITSFTTPGAFTVDADNCGTVDGSFSGDFTARPPSSPEELAVELAGAPLAEPELLARVERWYQRVRPEIPGVVPADWVAAVARATAVELPA